MQYDGTVNGFPYFSQNDDRWNGIRYGGGNIGTSGCGPTAAAMIVKSYGFDVTPENTAKVFVNALGGYRTTEGPTCFSALQNSPYNLTVQQTRNINTVVESLKNGIPVVANPQGPCDFTEHGHYVVLCGIDNNGNISVNDPNGNHYNMSKSKKWTSSYIANCCVGSNGKDGFFVISKDGKGSIGNTVTGSTAQTLPPQRETVINVPDGLGKYYTYMNWDTVTNMDTEQGKLIKTAGKKYDSDGYGKVGNRYTLAMTSTFGKIGDYVDVYMSNGRIIHGILADEKSQKYTAWDHNPANKWGHDNGQCIVEWVTNWKNHDNPKSDGTVLKVVNLGNYFEYPEYANGTESYYYSENAYENTEKQVIWNNRHPENIHKILNSLMPIKAKGDLCIYINDFDVTRMLGDLSWKNSVDELATTMSFNIAKTDAQYLKDLMYVPEVGEIVRMVIDTEVFTGVILSIDDGDKYVNKYTAADLGWYLNKTKQTYQFNKISALQAIKELCSDLSIPIDTIPDLTTIVDYIFFSETVSDIIKKIIGQCGNDYNFDFTHDGLRIYKIGDIVATPMFQVASNVQKGKAVDFMGNLNHSKTLENTATSVKVVSTNNNIYKELVVKQNRDAIDKYGFIQEIVSIDEEKENADTVGQAKLDELCKLEEKMSFEIIEEMNSYTRAGSVIEIDGTKYLISNTQHQIKSGFHYVKMDVEKL